MLEMQPLSIKSYNVTPKEVKIFLNIHMSRVGTQSYAQNYTHWRTKIRTENMRLRKYSLQLAYTWSHIQLHMVDIFTGSKSNGFIMITDHLLSTIGEKYSVILYD